MAELEDAKSQGSTGDDGMAYQVMLFDAEAMQVVQDSASKQDEIEPFPPPDDQVQAPAGQKITYLDGGHRLFYYTDLATPEQLAKIRAFREDVAKGYYDSPFKAKAYSKLLRLRKARNTEKGRSLKGQLRLGQAEEAWRAIANPTSWGGWDETPSDNGYPRLTDWDIPYQGCPNSRT